MAIRSRAVGAFPLIVPLLGIAALGWTSVRAQPPPDRDLRDRVVKILNQDLDSDERQVKLEAIGPGLLDALIGLLQEERHFYDASRVLERIGKPAVPRLIRGVESNRPVEAVSCLRILANINDDRKLPVLWESIQSSNENLRETALEASPRQPWPDRFWTHDRLEPVIKLTRHESEYLAGSAASLLLSVGDVLAIDELRAVLSDPESPGCERYRAQDITNALARYPHVDVQRLFGLVGGAHCWRDRETYDSKPKPGRPSPLWTQPDPGSDELLQTLKRTPPERTPAMERMIAQLMDRLDRDRSHELLMELGGRVDRLLQSSFLPSWELTAYSSLSPSRAASGIVEASDRSLDADGVGILSRLEEPAAVPVLLRRLRRQADPEQWFPVAHSLAPILKSMGARGVRDFLHGEGASDLQVEAVVQALDDPPADEKIAPGLPAESLDTDQLLRIVNSGLVEDRGDVWRLFSDRLATSSALLAALTKNPSSLDALTEDGDGADLVWALTQVPSPASTERLRGLLAKAGAATAMIARELGRRRDRASIPSLLALLGSKRDLDCSAAARALGDMRVQEASPSLRRELDRRRDEFVKRDLVEAIVRIEGDQAALELIRRRDLGPRIRHYLYFPLAKIEPAGVDLLLRVFRNSLPDEHEVWSAGHALVASGRLGAAHGLAEILLEFRGPLGEGAYSIKQQLLPKLTELYHSPELVEPFAELIADPFFEANAAEGLTRQPGEFADTVVRVALQRGASPSRFYDYLAKRPIPSLGPLLKSAYLQHGKKIWDLKALIVSGSPQGMAMARQLIETETAGGMTLVDISDSIYKTPHQEGWDLLPDLYRKLDDYTLFLCLLRIPSRPQTPELVDYLISLLDREPVEVKPVIRGMDTVDLAATAAAALDRLDAAPALDALLRHWDRESIRAASVVLVGRHPTPARVDSLFQLIRNRDYSMWRRVEIAIAAAARQDPDSIAGYADDPDPEIRRKLAAVGGEFQHPVTDRILLQLAQDPDPFVRAQAVASMDRGPADDFSRTVLEALKDDDHKVRREAVRTSGVLKIKEAVPILAARLAQADPPLAVEAAHSLSDLGGSQAAAALLKASAGGQPNLAAIRGLGRVGGGEAVQALLRVVADDNLEARHVALQALGRIATDEAVLGIFEAHLESRGYVAHYLQKRSQVMAESTVQPSPPTPSVGGRALVAKRPELAIPSDPVRFLTEKPLLVVGRAASDFSYHQMGMKSWILWTELERRGIESWRLQWSHSEDGERTWSAPQTIATWNAPLSHYQLVRRDNGEMLVLFARGRRIYGIPWNGFQAGGEDQIRVGSAESQIVKFNVLRRSDGTYLLFAAVGTPVPNALHGDSQLVVLKSRDLSTWTAPAPIAPIEPILGYFSVEYIPAVETPDGSVLVGVGGKLYRSRDLSDWDLVWDGEKTLVGWKSGVAALAVGSDGTIHLGYRSKNYGYSDLFVTASADLVRWSEPVFTTIHDALGGYISEELGSVYLLPGHGQSLAVIHYMDVPGQDDSRQSIGEVVRSELDLAALSVDSDQDGLSDAIEARLLTDPDKPDTDGDGSRDGEDANPLAPRRPPDERDKIRQAAFDRLNGGQGRASSVRRAAPLMIVVTDGDKRQEFSGYPGVILNLSFQERQDYWKRLGRFGGESENVVIVNVSEDGSVATVNTFAGHQGSSMTVTRLGTDWVVTKVTDTIRVY